MPHIMYLLKYLSNNGHKMKFKVKRLFKIFYLCLTLLSKNTASFLDNLTFNTVFKHGQKFRLN